MGFFRKRRSEQRPPITIDGDDLPATSESPGRSFGYNGAWLAVRASDDAEVADAQGLDAVTPIAWADGVAAVYAAEADELLGRR
jgi:hypothetical protein